MHGEQTNGAKAGFVRFFVGSAYPAERLAKTGCVRQKRVVPASVADAKLSVADAVQPDRFSLEPAATVTKRNSSPGRARHKP